MYVCVCHAITERQVIESVTCDGASTVRELRERLGIGHSCGRCISCTRDLLRNCSAPPPIAADSVAA